MLSASRLHRTEESLKWQDLQLKGQFTIIQPGFFSHSPPRAYPGHCWCRSLQLSRIETSLGLPNTFAPLGTTVSFAVSAAAIIGVSSAFTQTSLFWSQLPSPASLAQMENDIRATQSIINLQISRRIIAAKFNRQTLFKKVQRIYSRHTGTPCKYVQFGFYQFNFIHKSWSEDLC